MSIMQGSRMEDARKGVFGRVTTGARPKPAPNTQTTSILTNQRRCGRRRTLRTRQPNHQHQPSSEQRSPDRRGVGNEDQEGGTGANRPPHQHDHQGTQHKVCNAQGGGSTRKTDRDAAIEARIRRRVHVRPVRRGKRASETRLVKSGDPTSTMKGIPEARRPRRHPWTRHRVCAA